jgi:hypothetical protein
MSNADINNFHANLLKDNLKNFATAVFDDLKEKTDATKEVRDEPKADAKIDMFGDEINNEPGNKPKSFDWLKLLIKNLVVLLGLIAIAMGVLTAITIKLKPFIAGILLA